ncbi:hypothetical protein R1sor_004585 [Riccia sorocarpa]|uniref:Uncharacterized protein n=1 Tax=Riccia sorocarpa TaxID=122646 RepID=A0ABD3HNI3_9MARC
MTSNLGWRRCMAPDSEVNEQTCGTDLTSSERWIIVGDWNQVELPEDTNRKSTILHGAEERAWKRLAGQADLVDSWLVDVLKQPEALKKLQEIWAEENAADPRTKWALAWKKAAALMREESISLKKEAKTYPKLALEVASMRERTGSTASHEELELLRQKVKQLKDYEKKVATTWGRRSRARWTSWGDAPTRYVFALFKVKQKRESLQHLET